MALLAGYPPAGLSAPTALLRTLRSRPSATLGCYGPAERNEQSLLETSWPGVFAVGDVRCGNIKRVASAVGEGSIAISFVHRVLAE